MRTVGAVCTGRQQRRVTQRATHSRMKANSRVVAFKSARVTLELVLRSPSAAISRRAALGNISLGVIRRKRRMPSLAKARKVTFPGTTRKAFC